MESNIQQMKWADAQQHINQGVVYLIFSVTWCGDCKMMKPIIEEVANNFSDNKKVQIIEVDAEESKLFRDPKSEYQVLRVPTHIVLKDGKILNRGYEYMPREILVEWIEEALK